MEAFLARIDCLNGSLVYKEEIIEIADDYFEGKQGIVHYEESPIGGFDLGGMFCIFPSNSLETWRKAVLLRAIASRLSKLATTCRREANNLGEKTALSRGEMPTREFRKVVKRAVKEKTLTKTQAISLYSETKEEEAYNAMLGKTANQPHIKRPPNQRYYKFDVGKLPSKKDFIFNPLTKEKK